MQTMVKEVRDTVLLNNSECFGLQSAVYSKSIGLAKDRFHDEDIEFTKVVGKYRRMIWKNFKLKFNIPKYNCLRRIDYAIALDFVAKFRPEDYI